MPFKRKAVSIDRVAGPSDSQRPTESSRGVVRLGTVVADENAAVTAITVKRTAKFSDVGRRFHPTRSLGIEVSEFLKLKILFLGQKFDPHLRCHVHGGCFRAIFFA